jgi:hypothetical protein
MRKLPVLAASAAAFAVTACGPASPAAAPAAPAASPGTHAPVRASAAAVRTPPARPSAKTASDACDSRPNASGDIILRMITPGIQWTAQELGGEWRWDWTTGKCLTSVQLMMATAPTGPGDCTQAGYAAANPGYDVNAAVAPPLKHVAAHAGPGC